MPAMRCSRRIFGLVAVLAIAWGALWPLVSAAMPPEPRIPNFICSQSGFHGEAPPADRDEAAAKFHCPLCVTPLDATPPAIHAPSFVFERAASTPAPQAGAAFVPLFSARSPPSRAPPRNS